jgi:hypothetical protein
MGQKRKNQLQPLETEFLVERADLKSSPSAQVLTNDLALALGRGPIVLRGLPEGVTFCQSAHNTHQFIEIKLYY